MKKKSLTKQLNYFGMLITAVPLFFISYALIQQAGSALKTAYRERAQAVADGLAQTVDSGLEGLLVTGDSLAGAPSVIAMAEAVHSAGIQNSRPRIDTFNASLLPVIKGLGPNFSGLWLSTPDGTIFAGIKPNGDITKYRNLDITKRPYFLKLKKKEKTVISNALSGKSTGRAIVIVAVPVRSDSGEIIGILGISVNIDYLIELVARKRIGETGHGYMINESGRVIAHPDKENLMKLDITTLDGLQDFQERIQSGRAWYAEYQYKDSHKVGFFSPVSHKNWLVAVAINKDELLAPVRKMQKTAFSLSAVFIAAAILIIIFFSRRLAEPIRRSMNHLRRINDQVSITADQMTENSQALAEISSQQAAALEESSATLEEINGMVDSTAENAGKANEFVKNGEARLTAVSEAVRHLETAIGEIDGASRETEQIIKNIDTIAFQTNLLALNAAVEAARAGNAGAGFGVVSTEVKKLAVQTGAYAQNTARLIETSKKKIDDGVRISKETSVFFSEMLDSSRHISELMDGIAAGTSEQAGGIGQISAAMGEIEKVTQEHAASSETAAAASVELREQIQQMHSILSDLGSVVGNEGPKG